MFETIDIYCERLDSSFWAEPVNALANIAFIIAAWLVWQRAQQLQMFSFEIRLFIGLIAMIGVGSALFHTFATGWARLIDIVPILLFQLAYLFVYLRRVIQVQITTAAGILLLYLIVAIGSRQYPHILNGSLIYAPTLIVLLSIGIYHYVTQKKERVMLLAAAAAFLLSLTCRTFDMVVCPFFPLGTHFMWHILTPIALYLLMRGYLINIPTQK